MEGETESTRDAFANAPPELTILSDLALDPTRGFGDSFDLRRRIGPIYDILRHPQTRTPMTVAIYGDWGTGKTSAMRWLMSLLETWNAGGGQEEGQVRVRPVWFDPWKFDSKEEVWRGLLAEVVIASLDDETSTVTNIRTAMKDFGAFLGRGFMRALKIKAPGADVNLSEILEEYQQFVTPEKAYLNEFESTMRSWVEKTLGSSGDRMVVFIDDLDRCMPDVALQVLEALKLYLGVERMIFVVGVDRDVIKQLVVKYYDAHGLRAEKSENYLDKMFQAEVVVGPSEDQIKTYLDEQIRSIDLWADLLSEDERTIFEQTLLRLSQRNPREVKRLLNSAMIHGSGELILSRGSAVQSESADGDSDRGVLRVGLQRFFLRRVLELGNRPPWLDLRVGEDFFHDWSSIAAGADAPAGAPRIPNTVLPQGDDLEPTIPTDTDDEKTDVLKDVAPAYRDFASRWRMHARAEELLQLTHDEGLHQLMQIPFPGPESDRMSTSHELQLQIVREAIGHAIGIRYDDATKADLDGLKRLRLSGLDVDDLAPVRELTSIEHLDLDKTPIGDLSSISGLTTLTGLKLGSTRVTDLSPLQNLSALRNLDLSDTPVVDISPLRSLRSLEVLSLAGTSVVDLTPVADFAQLKNLTLSRTEIVDLSPLAEQRSLTSLSLNEAKLIVDLSVVASFKSLTSLVLYGTNVEDLSPLAALPRLRQLYVSRTRVSDLTPLAGVSSLQTLVLFHMGQVDDLSPLAGLTSLTSLNLHGTTASDLSPLFGLQSLKTLDLKHTSYDEAMIDELRSRLPNTEIKH